MTEHLNELKELPVYSGIAITDIIVVRTKEDAALAYPALMEADVLGFDTESKPTFFKGQHSDGPHLVQLATDSKAFLFPIIRPLNVELLQQVLSDDHIVKVGFGLSDDIRRLHSKLGIEVQNVVDLAKTLRQQRSNEVGAKTAVAVYLGERMQKSKKVSTSNWAVSELSERQLLYAANDAQVAVLVYRKWCESSVSSS